MVPSGEVECGPHYASRASGVLALGNSLLPALFVILGAVLGALLTYFTSRIK